MYPVLVGTVVIDGDFRYVGKKNTQILHDVVLVVEEGTSDLTDIVAACCYRLLSRTVVWTAYCLAQEVKLTCSNHVPYAGYVVEHPPHVFIVQLFHLDTEH